jgi:hypothetical protein
MAGFGKHGIKHGLKKSCDLEEPFDICAPEVTAVDMHVKPAIAVHEIPPALQDSGELPDLLKSFVPLQDGAHILAPVIPQRAICHLFPALEPVTGKMGCILSHHGFNLDPVLALGPAHCEMTAGKLLILREAFFLAGFMAVLTKCVSVFIPEAGIGTDLVLAESTISNALAKTALAIIPVVQLRIRDAVRFKITLASRAETEVLVTTSLAVMLATYFRHIVLQKHISAVRAGR